MLELLGMPVQASTHAADLDHMSVLVHWLVFVLARFRRKANPTASYVGAKGKVAKGLELAVVVAEIVLLVFYAIPAWATRVRDFPAEDEATVVRVVAEQFAWNVHYPGDDGAFGRTDLKLITSGNRLGLDRTDPAAKDDIVTVNQLNLPVNRPVLVHLSSKDVIHSFGLFEMRVKQDAVPGLDIPVWFIPNRVGEYEVACSQLCGLGHFRMRGFMTIQDDAAFRNFLAEEAKLLTP
jgi:cytochrome c oxidase subunit 2